MNSYENRVYQLELDDESWVVGKFYRPGRWPRETIAAEHDFLAELAEAEIPVAPPLEIARIATRKTIASWSFNRFDLMLSSSHRFLPHSTLSYPAATALQFPLSGAFTQQDRTQIQRNR